MVDRSSHPTRNKKKGSIHPEFIAIIGAYKKIKHIIIITLFTDLIIGGHTVSKAALAGNNWQHFSHLNYDWVKT